MKQIVPLIIILIFPISGYASFVGSDPAWLVDCMQAKRDFNPNYQNFYHGYDEAWKERENEQLTYTNTTGVRFSIVRANNANCWYLKEDWRTLTLHQMIPVYFPQEEHPMGFLAVFTDTNQQV